MASIPSNPGQPSMPVSTSPSKWQARSRSTPLASRGEPMVWLTGGALAVCAVMVVALLAIVLVGGARAFWPRTIERVTLNDRAVTPGQVFLGSVVRSDSYSPAPAERETIEGLQAAGTLPAGALDEEGLPIRRLYRVGNKEFRGQPFVWVPVYHIASATLEPSATLLERTAWGVWHGYPRAVLHSVERTVPGPASSVVLKEAPTAGNGAAEIGEQAARVERVVLGEGPDGTVRVRETRVWDASAEQAMAVFRSQHAAARARAAKIEEIKTTEVGRVNRGLEHERLLVRAAEIRHQRGAVSEETGVVQATGIIPGAMRWPVSIAALAGAVLCVGLFARRLAMRAPVEQGFLPPPDPKGNLINVGLLIGALSLALLGYLENPLRHRGIDAQQLAAIRAESAARVETLNAEYRQIQDRLATLDAADAEWRVLFVEPTTNRFAPVRQTEPDDPMRISAVVRAVQPNELTFFGNLGVYVARWGEFLLAMPREANTEGGIFPVIFGTVTLTLLLSVVVVPLGVVAALYLREYAKQGPMTSLIRIAINNLAGVPSIVYGVFGLGFFCYTVGAFVDTGSGILPGDQVNLLGVVSGRAVGLWWLGVILMGVLVVGTVVVGNMATPVPGKHPTALQRNLGKVAFAGWCLAAIGALALVAYTPYFRGFFEASAPAPTFAAKGMLWSSATLALLTLPVVIVATEEAIAAVPRSMREGSYGCGASKWQTMQRIVLPRAMPGIMTGMILAMARGAGEVAPLMLVGAVKLAESLPIDGTSPFVHLDRPFMHLGFHIYDVGFQSPDSEAARPIVWCTTLVLIVVVVALNITAIRIRSGLRRKFMGEAF
jgi:ABC-type phosphate transport system permease subunit